MSFPKLPFILAVFILSFLSIPAQAGLSINENEKAVIAYHKLLNKTPNYGRWISNSEHFLATKGSADEQKMLLEEETVRLKWGFGTYNPEQDFLLINTEGKASFKTLKNKQYFSFTFTSLDENQPFFPYSYGEEWIALLIKDIKATTFLNLNREDEKRIFGLMPPGGSLPVKIRLRVRPLTAEADPSVIAGQAFYPLLGDLAYVELTVIGQEKPLYSYTADWYLSANQNEVLDILQSQQ